MSQNIDAYAAALAEIEEGRLNKGAWARAFAESGGDESKAKALYIKARAESTNSSPAWSNTQLPIVEVPQKRVSPETNSGKAFPASKSTEYYEAALGEKNSAYYLDKFHAFDKKGPGLHASWNWAAFFFTGFWALYRKMYGWFVAWVGILTFFGLASRVALNSQAGSFWVLVANFAVVSGYAAYANSLYHAKVKALIDAARKSMSDATQVNGRLSSGSGVHSWVAYIFGGVPVIGIVAAIALPAYQDSAKRKAVAATPVQEPTAQEAPVKFWENDKIVSPAPQGVTAPTTSQSQIDEFLRGAPSAAPAAKVDWSQYEPVPNTNPGVEASKTVQQMPPQRDLYVQKVRGLQAAINRGEIPLTLGMVSFSQPTYPAQWLSSDAAVLESTQTWWRVNRNDFYIHVKNTLANPLVLVGIDYNEGDCRSNGDKRRFFVTPIVLVDPGFQSIIKFKLDLPVAEQSNGCLVIVSAWS